MYGIRSKTRAPSSSLLVTWLVVVLVSSGMIAVRSSTISASGPPAATPANGTGATPSLPVRGTAEVSGALMSLDAGRGPAPFAAPDCPATAPDPSMRCPTAAAPESYGSIDVQSVVESPAWTQETVGSSPPPRLWSMMTYDAIDGYVLLFGGVDTATGTALSDSWAYASGSWTQLHPSLSPSARDASGMTFDPSAGFVVLFGGDLDSNPTHPAQDTWKFVHGQWSELDPVTSPPARDAPGITYDANLGGVLMFGGYNGISYLSDTWAFTGTTWINESSPSGPSARDQSFLSYDSHDGYSVLFGGEAGGSGMSDTWMFASSGWTELHPSNSPTGRCAGAMVDDPPLGGAFLFGGYDSGSYFGDTWEFSHGDWTSSSSTSSPSARAATVLAYDAADGYLLLFGGNTASAGQSNDTWSLSAPSLNISVASESADVGQSIVFSVSAASPAGIATYAWLPSSPEMGCADSAGSTLSCTPNEAGNFSISVEVTDVNGGWTRAMFEYEILTEPSAGTPRASREAMDVGQNVTFSSTATGGTGSYTSYEWTGLPATGCGDGQGSIVTCRVPSAGLLSVSVRITDTNGGTSPASPPVSVLVAPSPTIAELNVSPTPVPAGTSMIMIVVPEGGSLPYSYAYSGLPAGCAPQNTDILNCAPTLPGLYTVGVRVTDSAGESALANLSVRVTAPSSSTGGVPGSDVLLVVGGAAAAVVIVVVAVALIFRRRSRPGPP